MDDPLPLKREVSERLRDDFLNMLINIRQQIFRFCNSEEERQRVTLTVFLALASEMVARSLMSVEEEGIPQLLGFFNDEVMLQVNDIKKIISENNLTGYAHSKEST
jgi:hypothetical protein